MALEKHVLFIDGDKNILVANGDRLNTLVYKKNYIVRNIDVEDGQMFDDDNIDVEVDADGYLKFTDKESGDFIYINVEFLEELSQAVEVAIETRNKRGSGESHNIMKLAEAVSSVG